MSWPTRTGDDRDDERVPLVVAAVHAADGVGSSLNGATLARALECRVLSGPPRHDRNLAQAAGADGNRAPRSTRHLRSGSENADVTDE